jgi:hypothetical protein
MYRRRGVSGDLPSSRNFLRCSSGSSLKPRLGHFIKSIPGLNR